MNALVTERDDLAHARPLLPTSVLKRKEGSSLKINALLSTTRKRVDWTLTVKKPQVESCQKKLLFSI